MPEEDIIPNLAWCYRGQQTLPGLCCLGDDTRRVADLLDHLVEFAPNPATHEMEHGFTDNEMTGDRINRKYNNDEPFSAYVFRTIADPFAGRINVMKVISGKIGHDASVRNTTRDTDERLGALHVISGKTLDKVDSAATGDIIAVAAFKDTQTGDTLSDKAKPIVFRR
ncbi:MAG: hypothetical protein IPI64_15125 [Chloracidobacterium sp.]|nr:hypothetical protein [Chloracidobacterium sp.]